MILRPVKHTDMEYIRRWRNAQISILRQPKRLSREQQEKYWEDRHNRKEKLFMIVVDGLTIGYGGFVHIKGKTAEGSYLIDPALNDGDYHEDFVEALKAEAKEAKITKITAETFLKRKAHIKRLEGCGFVEVCRDSNSIFHEVKV